MFLVGTGFLPSKFLSLDLSPNPGHRLRNWYVLPDEGIHNPRGQPHLPHHCPLPCCRLVQLLGVPLSSRYSAAPQVEACSQAPGERGIYMHTIPPCILLGQTARIVFSDSYHNGNQFHSFHQQTQISFSLQGWVVTLILLPET